MFIKAAKRIISLGLSFILAMVFVIGIIPLEKEHAASFLDIDNSTMFLKQNESNTCTLSAAAMLVRRAALLNGNSEWTAVTESSLKPTAWMPGVGLYSSFTYAGIDVRSAAVSSDRTQTMINLLSQHPEGIVIYDYGKPHAILLTDYTNGTFYCADPSNCVPNGRIPISQASITVESIDKYWYVSGLQLSLTAEDTISPAISDVRVTDINANGYTVTCKVEDAGGVAKVQFPTWINYGDQDDLMEDWWENPGCCGTQDGTTWSYRVKVSDHNYKEGYYNTNIYAWDMAGNSCAVNVNDIYVDRTPPVISEVEVVDLDAAGYTVTCKVEDASSGISKVQFPTWTVENGQDDLAERWWENPDCCGTQDGTTWSFRVNDKTHNFERGIYNTHIFAYDNNGNSTCYELNNIVFENTYFHANIASYGGHTK